MTRRVLMAAALCFAATTALAADVKTYQVTGPVVSVSDTTITVKKGNDNWEIAKTPETKTTGDVKAGDKVTVMYRMTATSVDAKPAGAKKK